MYTCLLLEPEKSPGRMVVGNLTLSEIPLKGGISEYFSKIFIYSISLLEVGGVSRTKSDLGEGDHWESEEKIELHKVSEGWLEMVSVAELHRMPSLNCSVKYQSYK